MEINHFVVVFHTSFRHEPQTLIGNSLGKLHLPIRFDADVFKAILNYSSMNVDLLNEWYQHNVAGHTYTLRSSYR